MSPHGFLAACLHHCLHTVALKRAPLLYVRFHSEYLQAHSQRWKCLFYGTSARVLKTQYLPGTRTHLSLDAQDLTPESSSVWRQNGGWKAWEMRLQKQMHGLSGGPVGS